MRLHKLALALALATICAAPSVMAQATAPAAGPAVVQPKEGWYRNLVDTAFVRANVDIPPKKGVMLIDSRPAARQYDPGHIPGAINIPDTQFDKHVAKLAARKQWMADHLQMRGSVVVDDGAVAKLRDEGRSLLPIGVIEVSGDFLRGDVIAVRAPDGSEIARGLANYSAAEARLIARKPSSQIEGLLGYANEPELIHRDNLVIA